MTPKSLYFHAPPLGACQYDQYAVAGGVSMHGSADGAGFPSMRQMKPSPHRLVPVIEMPALRSAACPVAWSPRAQRTIVEPPRS